VRDVTWAAQLPKRIEGKACSIGQLVSLALIC
jgi:hypothetical protein